MDRFLSTQMPPKPQKSRPESRTQKSKMAAAAADGRAGSVSPSAAGAGGSVRQEVSTVQVEQAMSSSPSEKPVTYADVVQAVQDVMAPLMEQQTAKLQQTVQDIKTQLHQLSSQVSANESRIGENLQDVVTLKANYTALQKSHLQLSNKVDDLENRSRRCNLRIVGLPEEVKGPDLFKFLHSTLPDLLGIQDACSGMIIERAHRLGPVRSESEIRPRVVIFKTLNFLHKEAIWMASRRCKELRWKSSRLHIFQDYSAEVTRARKEFTGLCARLIKENKKFALLFPARLRLFDGSSYKDFMTVEDADGYLKELQNAEKEIALTST